MKFLLNPGKKTTIVLCVFLFLTTLLTVYCGIAIHRVTLGILDAIESPQPFPHPDPLISWLNDAYDRRYPAPPGLIKLHGERDRVALTFLAILVPSASMSMILLQLILAPWLFPATRHRQGCMSDRDSSTRHGE